MSLRSEARQVRTAAATAATDARIEREERFGKNAAAAISEWSGETATFRDVVSVRLASEKYDQWSHRSTGYELNPPIRLVRIAVDDVILGIYVDHDGSGTAWYVLVPCARCARNDAYVRWYGNPSLKTGSTYRSGEKAAEYGTLGEWEVLSAASDDDRQAKRRANLVDAIGSAFAKQRLCPADLAEVGEACDCCGRAWNFPKPLATEE